MTDYGSFLKIRRLCDIFISVYLKMSSSKTSRDHSPPRDDGQDNIPELRNWLKLQEIPFEFFEHLSHRQLRTLITALCEAKAGTIERAPVPEIKKPEPACRCDDPNEKLLSCDKCHKFVCKWCRYDLRDRSPLNMVVMSSCKDCLLFVAEDVPTAWSPPPDCGAGYYAASEKKRLEEEEKEPIFDEY